MRYWPLAWGQDGCILAKFFFAFLWTEIKSKSLTYDNTQKRTRPITRTLSCGTNAGYPETARCSGSQWERMIRLYLAPARIQEYHNTFNISYWKSSRLSVSYGASFFFGCGCVSRISHSPEWAKNSFNKIRLRDSSTLSESGSKEQKQAKQ